MNAYPHNRPLRLALASNALFSLGSAALMIGWPDWVGAWLGISAPVLLQLLGAGLILFALDLLHQATRVRMASWRALYASAADVLWVLASLVLVMTGLFSPEGKLLVLAVAIVVLGMGVWQLWAIQRLHRLDNGEYRHCVRIAVAAPPQAIWLVISQLGDIQKYVPMLQSSYIRDQQAPGVGAVRVCADRSGKQWAEECTVFEPGRELSLRFLAREPNFPFPVTRMSGGWQVAPQGEHSEVTIWWELAPKKAWMAPMVMAMLSLGADHTFPRVLSRMTADAKSESAPASGTEPATRARLLPSIC